MPDEFYARRGHPWLLGLDACDSGTGPIAANPAGVPSAERAISRNACAEAAKMSSMTARILKRVHLRTLVTGGGRFRPDLGSLVDEPGVASGIDHFHGAQSSRLVPGSSTHVRAGAYGLRLLNLASGSWRGGRPGRSRCR